MSARPPVPSRLPVRSGADRRPARRRSARARSARARFGGVYLIVLSVSTIVTVLAIGGAIAWQRDMGSVALAQTSAQSRIATQASAEIVAHTLLTTTIDRSALATNPELVRARLSTNTVVVGEVYAADGTPITTDATLPMLVRAESGTGMSRQGLSFLLSPVVGPRACLNVPIATRGTFTISGSITAEHLVVSFQGGKAWPGYDASGKTSVIATTTAMVPWTPTIANAADMPDATTLSTWQSRASVCAMPGGKKIENAVLSPRANPYGATNAEGIYWFSGSGTVTLQNLRVVGTLIFSGVGVLQIGDSVCIEPAVPGYPALLTDSSIQFTGTGISLDETALAFNFNPPGTPYMGEEDSDTTDMIPAVINGLVYSKNSISCNGNHTIVGVVVAEGNVSISGQLLMQYDRPTNVPSGFSTVTGQRIVPGSIERLTN
ncbi:MAG: hypothetical protein IPK69_08370 [Phycisphaerales bacterium]|nr:MAG: hypothetical protein IPK69_08370 [Phycisphaerales bacterium]